MFRLVTNKGEIAKCQRALERAMRKRFSERIKRNIGYPSGTMYDAVVYTNRAHWYHTGDLREGGNPRRLNWFGAFVESGNLQIAVEINVPFAGRNDQVAGFFVRESRSGMTFLAHSGRVGGGTAGVGKTGFLAWTDQQLIEVDDNGGGIREGILVAPLNTTATVSRLVQYVDSITQYKAAVRAGKTKTEEFQRKVHEYDAYYEEARGRRKGVRRAEFDYVTRHGEIVSALHEWQNKQPIPQAAVPVKNVLIDMGIAINDELIEVFEAKPTADRSSIYTAIGQLFVHGRAQKCRRTIVLPEGQELAVALSEALSRLENEVLRFRFRSKGAVIVS